MIDDTETKTEIEVVDGTGPEAMTLSTVFTKMAGNVDGLIEHAISTAKIHEVPGGNDNESDDAYTTRIDILMGAHAAMTHHVAMIEWILEDEDNFTPEFFQELRDEAAKEVREAEAKEVREAEDHEHCPNCGGVRHDPDEPEKSS